MNRTFLKYGALTLLVVQTSTMVLVLRYTRTVKVDGPRYLSSTVVFLSEVVKFVSCLAIILHNCRYKTAVFLNEVHSGTIGQPVKCLMVAIPSAIYALQNNLLFVALSYLNAATYQVTYQLKILTTAVFAVLLLKQPLSKKQWSALLFLTIGVVLVQFPSNTEERKSDAAWSDHLYGLAIIFMATLSSGFAGVYFELLLKQRTFSLWVRNLQMALFGMFFSAIQMWWTSGDMIAKDGLFQGYNFSVLVVLLLQAYGGLLVACVIQYADNIVKGFAVSISIIVSSLISYMAFDDLQPSLLFVVGTLLVVGSTFIYGHKSQLKSR